VSSDLQDGKIPSYTESESLLEEVSLGNGPVIQDVSTVPMKSIICKRSFTDFLGGKDNRLGCIEAFAGEMEQEESRELNYVKDIDPRRKTLDLSKTFKCTHPMCGKAFKARTKLISHMHLHSGTQPHKCQHPGCYKAFSERANLEIHMRIHRNLKPFICPLGCGKAFRTKGNMQEHERRHYSDR